MMRIIERAVERASRLLCRYSYRHSSKNAGEDAGMAGWKPALRIERDAWLAVDNGQFLRRTTLGSASRYAAIHEAEPETGLREEKSTS
ncbi:MAG: hypothetical protein ABSF25_15670 [Bryobacteraceae bacterium]